MGNLLSFLQQECWVVCGLFVDWLIRVCEAHLEAISTSVLAERKHIGWRVFLFTKYDYILPDGEKRSFERFELLGEVKFVFSINEATLFGIATTGAISSSSLVV